MPKPILMLGLDGWSQDIAETLIKEGRMPAFARLQREAAIATLDHGDARWTGLAWEHVATGRSPDDARRWAAVDFDKKRYRAENKTTRQRPFLAELPISAVVFDAPYFDLSAATEARGMVNWGAHDPGIATFSQPASLAEEIVRKFGPYPAKRHIYGEVWYDPDEAQTMADALAESVEVRADVTEWLLAERLPDWDLAFTVISEFHSAVEALYHGWDESHPLHGQPSAVAARSGIVRVYEAVDRMVARLLARFPQATFVLFNLHGMGPNGSDVASMALLPELMYRMQFGKPLMRRLPVDESGDAMPPGRGGWSHAVTGLVPKPALIKRVAGRAIGKPVSSKPMYWMPAVRYQPYWKRMEAFALPSFYDGRIRVNLVGRERHGMVAHNQYESVLDRIETALMDCRQSRSEAPIVTRIERNMRPPLDLEPSQADLIVQWQGAPNGLVHPRYGTIGPLPYRRPGGHTGGDGIAYFHGAGIKQGPQFQRSAFDVVPTVIEMLGHTPYGLSGRSFAHLISR